jgi:hypothetical protein
MPLLHASCGASCCRGMGVACCHGAIPWDFLLILFPLWIKYKRFEELIFVCHAAAASRCASMVTGAGCYCLAGYVVVHGVHVPDQRHLLGTMCPLKCSSTLQ